MDDLKGEVTCLRRDVDALERKLANLSPEDMAQIQVQLAVLQNSLINLRDHIDRKSKDTEADIAKLADEKVSKSEVKIPHLIIYAVSGAILLAFLYSEFARLGLHHP